MPSFEEAAWWGDCASTWHEEQKQFAYAKRMGLIANWNCAHPPMYDLQGRSIIDIGGGPVSLLLKCSNGGRMVVADPAGWPEWVVGRYAAHGVEYWQMEGESESLSGYTFDEAWIYNVLQHVTSPEIVIERARGVASTIRIFEWIDIDPYAGHPHLLTQVLLETLLGGAGFTAEINEGGAVGRAFYGVFATSG